MTELSDELLVAYVDGQLAHKQTRAVEKVLEQDDVIAKRVGALKDAHGRLEAAFEAILAGEEADAAARPVPQPPGLLIPWMTLIHGGLAATGIAVALVLALFGFGWPLAMPDLAGQQQAAPETEYVGSVPRSWQEDVARAQALLSRESLEIGLESQGNADLVAFQLAQALGANFTPPDLGAQGFDFRRAQLLRFDDEPLVQLLYLGTAGDPLALYAKKGQGDSPPAFKRYGDLGSVAWSQAGVAYFLAGENSESSLMRLADAVRTERPQAAQPAGAPPPPLPRQKPKP
jgi:anti-sigma factor RsiW